MRKLASVVIAAGLLVSLSACAGGSAAGDCNPTYGSGDSSALVIAKGKLGDDPKADFPTPLVAPKTQVSVVSRGDGRLVRPGDAASLQITIYDASSGDALISTDYAGEGLLLQAIDAQPLFGGVAQCASVGSRVAAVGPAGEIVGEAAIQQNGLAVTAEDSVVLVVDVLAGYLGKANGADQLAQPGFPSIVLAPDGRPGFTIPSGDAPTDLRIAALKVGSGATVKEGDEVVVNYTGVLWDSKTVFDSSWDRNAPAVFLASDGEGGVVPGFATALIGQKVGSQVIVVIPPEFGYPAGSAPQTVPEGSTMVFVFDVLGIVS